MQRQSKEQLKKERVCECVCVREREREPHSHSDMHVHTAKTNHTLLNKSSTTYFLVRLSCFSVTDPPSMARSSRCADLRSTGSSCSPEHVCAHVYVCM